MITNPTINILTTTILLRISFQLTVTMRRQVVLELWRVKRFLRLRLCGTKWPSLFRVINQQVIRCGHRKSRQNQRTNENHTAVYNVLTFCMYLHDDLCDNWNETGYNFDMKGRFWWESFWWMIPCQLYKNVCKMLIWSEEQFWCEREFFYAAA